MLKARTLINSKNHHLVYTRFSSLNVAHDVLGKGKLVCRVYID